MPEIKVLRDAQQVADAAADHVAAMIADTGRFSLALAGGSTPRALYKILATKHIDWSHVHIFWGDERCVPPDHVDSNYRMAREAILGHIPIPSDNIHPMQGDIDPVQAAAEYEHGLRVFFGKDQPPRFDLILLGMGDDGHTASLFPGTAAIHEKNRWVVAHYVDKLETWRITLTPVVLNAAAQVMFLVMGAKKAERLKQVLSGVYQPDVLPSQIVKVKNVLWIVDEAAASSLEEGNSE